MLKLILFILSFTACQTTSANKESDDYFWNLIVDGQSHPNVAVGTKISVGPYKCKMDRNIKTIRTATEMNSRWLQCDKGDDFFRLMTECKSQDENSSHIIIGKNKSRKRTLIELSCVNTREL